VRLQFAGAEMPPGGPRLQSQLEDGAGADGEDSEIGSVKPDDAGVTACRDVKNPLCTSFPGKPRVSSWVESGAISKGQ
jgi:hypothetical protein